MHNQPAYVLGEGLAFFALMGLMGVAEAQLARRLPRRCSALLARAPAPLPALGLQLIVLPAFARFFVRSWLQASSAQKVGICRVTLWRLRHLPACLPRWVPAICAHASSCPPALLPRWAYSPHSTMAKRCPTGCEGGGLVSMLWETGRPSRISPVIGSLTPSLNCFAR